MPEISRFLGMIISMFWEKNERHHKPHIHVYYNDNEAEMGIDGELLNGYLPPKQLKYITAWVALHEDELYEDWIKAVKEEQLNKIDPLR